MGVMDYTPDSYQDEEQREDIKPSLCMIWDKLLELEALVQQLMQEVKKIPLE